MAHKILEEAQEINDLLIKWRRDLHQIPETDLELPKTVEYISKRLDEMNVEYKVFPEVSVIIAQIGKGDKCFLLRSDMDALPVEEETGLEFASKNGCMHGCGHDLHATILLGAAKILKAHEEESACRCCLCSACICGNSMWNDWIWCGSHGICIWL